MSLKHYRILYNRVRDDGLVKLQAAVLFMVVYIDWTLMPFVTKLEGLYLPVYMISVYMLAGASDGLIQPLFKRVKLHRIYLFVIFLDLVQMGSYLLSGYDLVLFTYAILTVFTLQAVTFEVARIHTIAFMQHRIDLKEYLMLRSFIVSSAIILGAGSAIVLDALDAGLKMTLVILASLGMVSIIMEYRLYIRFKTVTKAQPSLF